MSKRMQPKNTAIEQIISRAREERPADRAEFLRRHSASEIGEIHAALVGDAKPKTPRPILEKRILAALAEPVGATPIAEAEPVANIADEDAQDADNAAEGAPTAEAVADPAAAAEGAPTGETDANDAAIAKPAQGRDSRVPAVGTTLYKKDRHGAVRCECKVVDGGIEYSGKIYKSLSGAGLAAQKDLGLLSDTCDGGTFWQLKKVGHREPKKDAIEALTAAWNRYRDCAEAATRDAEELRAKLHDAINQHLAALNLLAASK